MGDGPGRPGSRNMIKHTARPTHWVVSKIVHRIDVDTLPRAESAARLALNNTGRVVMPTNVPLAFDPYRRNRATGSFILVDEATNDTVAAGMIVGSAEPATVEPTPQGTRSANVVWEPAALTRDERAGALGFQGATIWITGLPSAGKSTLAGGI